MIGAQNGDGAGRVDLRERQRPVLRDQRQQIERWRLQPVDLAIAQRDRGRRRIGDDSPLDPLEPRALRPRGPGRLAALTRHIAAEPRIGRPRADDPFVGKEAIGSAADHLGDLDERAGQRMPLGHDEWHVHADLGERIGQQGEGLAQAKDDVALALRGHLVGGGEQGLPHRVALAPARKARHAVARAHRRAVMEAQPLAQPQGPAPPVGPALESLDHLGLRPEIGIEAEQCVIDEEAMRARDAGSRPDRVERGEIGLWREAQQARVPPGCAGWQHGGAQHGGSATDHRAPPHVGQNRHQAVRGMRSRQTLSTEAPSRSTMAAMSLACAI